MALLKHIRSCLRRSTRDPSGPVRAEPLCNDILAVVIVREELSPEDTQTLASWVIAHAAGPCEDAAVDATPAVTKTEPERVVSVTAPESFLVNCVVKPTQGPAGNLSGYTIPNVLGTYANAVSQPAPVRHTSLAPKNVLKVPVREGL